MELTPKKTKAKTKIKISIEEFEDTEKWPIKNILDFTTNIQVPVYTSSSVIKLPEACYRGAIISEDRYSSEEYLLNSKTCSIDMSFIMGINYFSKAASKGGLFFRHLLEEDCHHKNEIIRLPKPIRVKALLDQVVRSRRSVRKMYSGILKLSELSTILFYANGVTGDADIEDKDSFTSTKSLGAMSAKLRTVPSAGALYPVYLYLVIQNVESLEDGLYKYLPLTQSLKKMQVFNEDDKNNLRSIAMLSESGIEISKLNIMIFYVYSLYENSRKYGSIGLTFGLIEVGGIAQNIHLVSTALKLASCDIGGYYKVPCEKFIGVDGLTKHVVHLTVIGGADCNV